MIGTLKPLYLKFGQNSGIQSPSYDGEFVSIIFAIIIFYLSIFNLMQETKSFIGIDVSKDTLQIAFQSADGKWIDSKVSNTLEAINEWLQTIHQHTFIIFEYTGTYSSPLMYCLGIQGIDFYALTATQSSGFSKSLRSTSKTDKEDARKLFLYGVKMQPEATLVEDEILHRKRQKFKHLSLLKSELGSYQNRLHALGFDPIADELVKQSIESVIVCFQTQIEALNKELFNDSDDNLDYKHMEKLLTSIKGIGQVSATALMVATNGFQNFECQKALAKFLGVCPTDKSSGNVKGKSSVPKSGNAFVRKALFMAALNAKKYNTKCKELYTRLISKGKTKKVAIMAVMHKLVRQAFAVVKNKTDFVNDFKVAI